MDNKVKIIVASIGALIIAGGVTGGVVYSSRQKQEQEQARKVQLERAKAANAIGVAEEYFALSNRHETLLIDVKRKGDDWLQIIKRNDKAFQKAREKWEKETERVRQHNIDERLRAQQEYYYRPVIWSEPSFPTPASAPPPPAFRSEADQLKKMVNEAKAFRLKSDELPQDASTEKLRRLLSTCIVAMIDTAQTNADAADKLAVAAAGSQSGEEGEGGEGEEGEGGSGYITADHLKALKAQANKTYNEALLAEVKQLKSANGMDADAGGRPVSDKRTTAAAE